MRPIDKLLVKSEKAEGCRASQAVLDSQINSLVTYIKAQPHWVMGMFVQFQFASFATAIRFLITLVVRKGIRINNISIRKVRASVKAPASSKPNSSIRVGFLIRCKVGHSLYSGQLPEMIIDPFIQKKKG